MYSFVVSALFALTMNEHDLASSCLPTSSHKLGDYSFSTSPPANDLSVTMSKMAALGSGPLC